MAKRRLYDVIPQKPNMIRKKNFFKCISNHAEQLLPQYTSLENLVKVPKKVKKLLKNVKITTINDDIRQKMNIKMFL